MNDTVSISLPSPLVSLAIPAFNHARYLKQCIESAIAQDYRNIELIIIDDGSTDNTKDVIEGLVQRCRDRFVRFEYRSRPNVGLCATLNEALQWSLGTYFAALDSDDVLKHDKVSRLLPILENQPNLAGVFSGSETIDEKGMVQGAESSPERNFTFDDIITHRHTFSSPGQLLKTGPMKEVGGYANGIYIQDWYMWLKLAEAGYQLKNVPDILVQYRYHDANISKHRMKMFEARRDVLSHFNHHPLHGLSLAIICVWAAIDVSCISKGRTLVFLVRALASCGRILRSRYFVKGILMMLTPCFMIRHAVWLKLRWPRLFAYLPSGVHAHAVSG